MASLDFPDLNRMFDGTDLDPTVAQREFVAYARREVDALIQSGRASQSYETYVNNHAGPLESVVLPGPIVFLFQNWTVAINGAIEELQKRVPRKSGRYAGSFIVVVNDRIVTDFNAIASDAEVTILNRQPYTRKMESGANKTGAKHFDLAKGAFNRRFGGAFNAQLVYLNVASGLAPGVPYILKASAGRRKDRQAGMPISYPSLVLKSVI